MGVILKKAFEKQLNGDLEKEDDAISWAKSNLAISLSLENSNWNQ